MPEIKRCPRCGLDQETDMADIGRRGGKAGKGKAKARTPEQARAAGIASGESRRRARDVREGLAEDVTIKEAVTVAMKPIRKRQIAAKKKRRVVQARPEGS